MSRGPKLVLTIQGIVFVLTVFWAFARLDTSAGFSVVIQSAIMIGLYTRQPAAWLTARWLSGIGAVVMSILVIATAFSGGTKLWIWLIVACDAALEWVFFFLLGRPDSREYFNARRKV